MDPSNIHNGGGLTHQLCRMHHHAYAKGAMYALHTFTQDAATSILCGLLVWLLAEPHVLAIPMMASRLTIPVHAYTTLNTLVLVMVYNTGGPCRPGARQSQFFTGHSCNFHCNFNSVFSPKLCQQRKAPYERRGSGALPIDIVHTSGLPPWQTTIERWCRVPADCLFVGLPPYATSGPCMS